MFIAEVVETLIESASANKPTTGVEKSMVRCRYDGIPLGHYADCHSIFCFVRGLDSVWREHKPDE